MIPKTRNLKIKEGNYNRRVKYNDKNNFDVLIVNLQDGIRERSFRIESKYLPDNDSIHLIYNPISHEVGWSPKKIISHVDEVR